MTLIMRLFFSNLKQWVGPGPVPHPHPGQDWNPSPWETCCWRIRWRIWWFGDTEPVDGTDSLWWERNFTLGLGRGCKQPALVSCEGKNFLFSLGWACRWASPNPLTTSWKCCSWPQGGRECPGEEAVHEVLVSLGLCDVVTILRVVLCSYYSQTFSKDT